MLIRTEQMKQLSNVSLRSFEDEMVAHLAAFSPPLFKVIKAEQMRKAVRFGIKRAGEYGFTLRGPTRLYLELMLLFGSHFDTDPQYPWAGKILQDDLGTVEMERAEQLHQKTLEYQEEVSGPDAVNTRKALHDLSELARSQETFSTNDLRAYLRQEMNRIFPQKARYVGEEGLAALIEEGISEAHKYKFPTNRTEALLVVLMFAFGHGCTNDLLYPWIGRTLEDEKITNPNARAERLEKKAVTWLDHALASLQEGAQA